MCGRYSIGTSEDELIEAFEVAVLPAESLDLPRFNVAPTQQAPALVLGPEGRRLGSLRWGLIPYWADSPSIGNRLINARSESVHQKPAFRDAFERRRCLIPSDGFFEWKKEAQGGPKTPYWIHRPDRKPFTLAGLWERWRAADGDPLHTFTILTTRPTAWMSSLHDRMPVVIGAADRDRWMSRDVGPAEVADLLGPPGEDYFTAYPVSTHVNQPANDDPECVEPVDGQPSS